MRYDDVRRASGISGFWLRLKIRMAGHDWLRPVILPETLPDLSDHLRRDIGAPDPVRHMDWKSLRDKAPL